MCCCYINIYLLYKILNNFLLLDEVFVISRIIKVEVVVISQSHRLRLIILTEALIILDITKTESNNYTLNEKKNNWKSHFHFFTDGKQHKKCKLDMIILRNHAQWSYMTWLLMTLGVPDMIIVKSAARWPHRRWFQKFTVSIWPIRKEIMSSIWSMLTSLSDMLLVQCMITVITQVVLCSFFYLSLPVHKLI